MVSVASVRRCVFLPASAQYIESKNRIARGLIYPRRDVGVAALEGSKLSHASSTLYVRVDSAPSTPRFKNTLFCAAAPVQCTTYRPTTTSLRSRRRSERRSAVASRSAAHSWAPRQGLCSTDERWTNVRPARSVSFRIRRRAKLKLYHAGVDAGAGHRPPNTVGVPGGGLLGIEMYKLFRVVPRRRSFMRGARCEVGDVRASLDVLGAGRGARRHSPDRLCLFWHGAFWVSTHAF
ncbi:hypothetical protein EDC01DRAFT_460869 [Geopyxis carbonaria]|nr:hypothetical protein EDC01DRAFT_460869 [Geopyxis carbonaria]